MRAFIASLLVLSLAAAAGAQRSGSGPAADAALVQEFMGLAKAKARTPAVLRADYARAVKYLLARRASTGSSSRVRQAADNLERMCLRAGRPGAEADRAALCEVLLGYLTSATPQPTRLLVLDVLGHIGGAESAGVLGRCLSHKDPQVRESARRALAGNRSGEAVRQIYRSLDSAIDAKWKVALINALGFRREASAIDRLGKLLKDRDEPVALAAAAALARIGGDEAIDALNTVRADAPRALWTVVSDALLACADREMAAGDAVTALNIYRKSYENTTKPTPVRVAAFRRLAKMLGEKATPMVMNLLTGNDPVMAPVAMEAARSLPGEAVTKALADLVAQTSPPRWLRATSRTAWQDRKVALVELLGERGDTAARPVILGLLGVQGRKLKTYYKPLRIAAIKALGGVGTEADVPLLAKLAVQRATAKPRTNRNGRRPRPPKKPSTPAPAQDDTYKWARLALRQLKGDGVNRAIFAQIEDADDAMRRELIACLAARNATELVDDLMKLAEDSGPTTRYAVFNALSALADERALDGLVSILVGTNNSDERYAAERAVRYICRRSKDKQAATAVLADALKGASVAARCSLIRACGQIGGPKALEALRLGAADPNDAVRGTAIQAMSYSTDPSVADDLLKAAQATKSKEVRALALRGYFRVLRYRRLAPEQMIWMYIRAMDAAKEPDEKKYALAGLGDLKTLGAMKLAMEHLYTPELQETAAVATYRVARHLYATEPKEVAQAMQLLLQLCKKEAVVKEAQRILALAQKAMKKK